MGRSIVRYSEAFKQQVVGELEQGKFISIRQASQAYGIGGGNTIGKWLRKYGSQDLLPKHVRIETLKERDELKEARKRIRQLEAALADAHIDHDLESSYLKIVCERMGVDLGEFKKKNVMTLSDIRKTKMGIK